MRFTSFSETRRCSGWSAANDARWIQPMAELLSERQSTEPRSSTSSWRHSSHIVTTWAMYSKRLFDNFKLGDAARV